MSNCTRLDPRGSSIIAVFDARQPRVAAPASQPLPIATATARSPAAALTGVIVASFGWLMCTLAAGAVSAFASMLLGVRPYWLVLLLAAPLAWVLGRCGCLWRRQPGAPAALAVALAAFYATSLVAVARIAAATGYTFGAAFRTGGIALTLQVARLGLDAYAVLAYAAAAVIAALTASRIGRPR